MSNFNTTSNQNNNIYPNHVSIIAILRSIGMLQQMNIGKYSQKRHLCPNRVNKTSATNSTNSPTCVSSKPTYYIKIPWSTTPKPKMSNSFELLQGSIADI